MRRIFGIVCVSLLFLGILSAEASAAYVVCERGGYVAAEDADSGETVRTDVRTRVLPASDRERLRDGIVCRTRQELAACIEDLSP